MKKILIFLLIATSLVMAEDKQEKKMTEDEFVDIYVELSLAAEKYLADQDSVAHAAKMDTIFADAGYTNPPSLAKKPIPKTGRESTTRSSRKSLPSKKRKTKPQSKNSPAAQCASPKMIAAGVSLTKIKNSPTAL